MFSLALSSIFIAVADYFFRRSFSLPPPPLFRFSLPFFSPIFATPLRRRHFHAFADFHAASFSSAYAIDAHYYHAAAVFR